MITSSRLPCTASRAAAALLVMITLHGCDSAGAGTSAPTGNGADLGLFRDVLKQVEKSYVEPVKDSELVKDALKGMLTRLDPHSDYMDQEQYEQMTAVTRGQFGGIGVELTLEARVPEVIAPIDGTPAADAGIEPGDRIIKIDAQSTTGMDVEEIVKRLRGAPGTKVTLTISRNDRPLFDLTLTRTIIHVVSVKSDLKDDNIGYVRIAAFTESTSAELVSAVGRLKDRAHGRLNGLILDLRNDPGGLLDAAVEVAGDFIDGVMAVSRTSILLGADALVAAIDELLRAADWDAFLTLLPRMRAAFERLHQRQRDALAERVAHRYGLARKEAVTELRASVAAAALIARIDRQVAEFMKAWDF